MEIPELQLHCSLVVNAFSRGRVVPFLGAGINACDRPTPARTAAHKEARTWSNDSQFLPTGSELAHYLAAEFLFPGAKTCALPGCHNPEHAIDLARVTQYAETALGGGRLREELRSVFARKYAVTSAHQFLASLALPAANAKRVEDRYPLFVTTNYDDLMEQALEQRQVADLVYYQSTDDRYRAAFWHKPPDGDAIRIEDANRYEYRFCEDRPVVLKVHGTMSCREHENDAYVITEDDYIEFLAEEALSNLLPASLLAKLRNNHLLFLGYSLKDWNLRVFLRRLKRNPQKAFNSWAILLHADAEEREFWSKNGIKILDVSLSEYIGMLQTTAVQA